eukprot:TRINITY_DN10417_c0_g1_i1.p1 TRINITY_DN10417_c0_g1~~TRINITY_DN10417_c0_g1_i1.p1  ORF type:complete len:665 (+),score=106.30 TRINITY_DN10417_c0_g1_i1:188-2182(+)
MIEATCVLASASNVAARSTILGQKVYPSSSMLLLEFEAVSFFPGGQIRLDTSFKHAHLILSSRGRDRLQSSCTRAFVGPLPTSDSQVRFNSQTIQRASHCTRLCHSELEHICAPRYASHSGTHSFPFPADGNLSSVDNATSSDLDVFVSQPITPFLTPTFLSILPFSLISSHANPTNVLERSCTGSVETLIYETQDVGRNFLLAGLTFVIMTASFPVTAASASSLDAEVNPIQSTLQPNIEYSVPFDSPELAARLKLQVVREFQEEVITFGDFHGSDGADLAELAGGPTRLSLTAPPVAPPVLRPKLGLEREGMPMTQPGPTLMDPATDIVAASFMPSASMAGMAVTSSAQSLVSAASEVATSALQPAVSAVAGPTAGLAQRLSTILSQAVQHFAGGGIAGAVGATVVYPLDTVKTKMQAQRRGDEKEDRRLYKNEWDCATRLVKEEGVGSLYAGLGPQLLGVAPEKAMKLTVNELILQVLEAFLPGARIWALEFIAGGGGGLSQTLFTNPVEVVKVRLQTQQQTDGEGAATKPKSPLEVVQELGLKGLYSGTLITLARDVPGSALFFACYAFLKQVYPDQLFLDGCIAAIPPSILVTPMDVVKTRMTMKPQAGEVPYTDGLDCVRQIVAKEGVGALFQGCFTRVLRISPQFGITLMIYDLLSR